MNKPKTRDLVALVLAIPLVAGCSANRAAGRPLEAVPSVARADSTTAMADHQHMAGMSGMEGMSGMDGMSMAVPIPEGALYTTADVQFMQGMIAHHAQAIFMSRMAESHGANPRLLRLANKIDQSQAAEINLMQGWLRANKQFAPDTSSWRTMMMAGMLTPAQLKTLDASRGAEFDKNYLMMMIQHHEGALKMVADLYAAPLSAQDVDVSVFANDIEIVQTAEIALMHQMLANLGEL